MNEYIFLDANGNVKSTLKTKSVIKESDTVKKVADSDLYAGKRYEQGTGKVIVRSDVQVKTKADKSKLSVDEKLDLILVNMGLAE